jgi:hypothetical protein
MGKLFWIRRFLLVFSLALVVIAGAQLLKGRGLRYSSSHGLVWATITATTFTAARIYQSRRKQHCAICRDTPEMAAPHPHGAHPSK